MISEKEKKELSIIIVNYKSDIYLEKCLLSLLSEKLPKVNFEIIIVNNDRKSDLNWILKKFPQALILNSPQNNGFGSGNNLGAKKACGEFLFFLNPDTELWKADFEKIFSLFQEDCSLGIVGVGVVSFSEKFQRWIFGKEMGLRDLIKKNLKISSSKKNQKDNNNKIQETDWVSGVAFFVRKKLFFEVGGFDENFFMYFEDMDLCRRIRFSGKKVLYYPKFLIKHKGGKSYVCKNDQKRDYYKSQEYYFSKHKGKIQTLILKLGGFFLRYLRLK